MWAVGITCVYFPSPSPLDVWLWPQTVVNELSKSDRVLGESGLKTVIFRGHSWTPTELSLQSNVYICLVRFAHFWLFKYFKLKFFNNIFKP